MEPPENASGEQVEVTRHLVVVATQRLLGDTIQLSDEAWRGASRLPGWSRGHVASHIARQAEGLARLADWARSGERQEMYASAEQRAGDIEAGSGRSGLALQIDLDTTAGALDRSFDRLDEAAWAAMVEFRDKIAVPARALPLARLSELVLHHVDLDCGYEVDDIDDETAGWLLEWCGFRLRHRPGLPRLDLVSDTGVRVRIGSADAESGADTRTISGTTARLLGWLTGRAAPDRVSGTDGLILPAY